MSIHLAEVGKGVQVECRALCRNVNWELVCELVGLRWTLCECIRPYMDLLSVLIEKILLMFDCIFNRAGVSRTGIMDKLGRRVKDWQYAFLDLLSHTTVRVITVRNEVAAR